MLFALEGAIVGLHEAALPELRRRELVEWYKTLPVENSPHSGS